VEQRLARLEANVANIGGELERLTHLLGREIESFHNTQRTVNVLLEELGRQGIIR
jgi:uncharacterized coiled-coil protein SlyX